MNWEAIGAIAELVAALAVVISLVYLALQVKEGTEAARTSTYESIVSDFGALNRVIASTPDLSALFVRGQEDYGALTADERARVSQLFFVCFHNFENIYYQYRKGYLEDDVWLGWRRLMLAYHGRPGFQLWWSMRSRVFSPSFVEFLVTEKLDIAVPSYVELTTAQGGQP